MPDLLNLLELPRCPYCAIDTPNLVIRHLLETTDFQDLNRKFWGVYVCSRCGGAVLAWAWSEGRRVIEHYPEVPTISEDISERARQYLIQAGDSLHAPAGAVMLAASAVDAMLKEKNYKTGTLNQRIDKAATDHLITEGMKDWAHKVRLGANDQRHADEGAALPSSKEAEQLIEFAKALAQFLFVLPAMVSKGVEEVNSSE